MSESIKRKLEFFKDCLDAESQSRVIWNFPTRNSSHVKELDQIDELIGVDQGYYYKLNKTLEYYTREKRLLLSVFFLQGSFAVPSFGGSTRIKDIKCPIFYFPCELSTNSFFNRTIKSTSGGPTRSSAISVTLSKGSINSAATQILEHYSIDAEKHLLPLLACLSQPEKAETQEQIISKLSANLLTASQGNMSLLRSNFCSVEPKQNSDKGSLYELKLLMQSNFFSRPLESLLKERTINAPSFWDDLAQYWPFRKIEIPLPAVLSNAQSAVLDAANQYSLSVVSGPPGTGKSFTIACLALREFSKSNSVLVVSQNQHAVDVVRRKLIDDMGVEPGLTVLGSEKGVSRDVKAQILLMLQKGLDMGLSTKKLRKKITKLSDKKNSLESEFHAHLENLRHSNDESVKSSFWSFGIRKTKTSEALLFEKFRALDDIDNQVRAVIKQFMKVHHNETSYKLSLNSDSKKSLEAFANSLTAKNEHYQERYYQDVDFEHVLKAIPFWFCSVGNLNRILPFKKEMFDLVVIDEASQCNMSICLPALQRAKRAVIVGDPKQLRHVSFVSYDLQERLAKAHSINIAEISDNFRGNSVLDYAQSALDVSQQSSQLDEHFRSHPQIINFSNKEFYDNSLKIMTERPTNQKRSIDVVTVKGKRLNKGVNKIEAESLINKLKKIIDEQSDLPEKEVHTLGVLAFFSAQAGHIEKLVFDQLSLNDIRRHNIRVGNPFSFQGEERDHMLISCSVDKKTPGGSYTYLNRDDVFNVAITRARDYQTLFVSCKKEELNLGSKLSSYLKYVDEYQKLSTQNNSLGYDSFQNEICNWLDKRGVDTYKNYLVAGISIDIMAVYHGHAIAIDLIGFQGELEGALPLTQFKLLQRAGLDSFLLPYQEWREQPEKILQNLMLSLGVIQQLPTNSNSLEKFTDQQEQTFATISKGISINQLHSRFIRNEEMYGANQLIAIVQRYKSFVALLNDILIPEELTYKRYLNAVHQLIKYCLNNLQKASVATELANSMFEQQKALFGEAKFNDDFDDVIAARLSMVDEQRAKFKGLINEAENALLQIDKTMVKLDSLKSNDPDIDPIEALQELTARLELYRDTI